MLNALRLSDGVETELFTQRTGLSLELIQDSLTQAQALGLLAPGNKTIRATPRGLNYLNDLTGLFLHEAADVE